MIKGYPSSQKRGDQKYATIQPLGAGKYGTDVLPKALTEVLAIDQVPEVGSTEDTIILTGHQVKAGDILRFNGGFLDYQEVTVESVTANSIKLVHKFDQPITPSETFRFLRTVTLTTSKEGGLSISSSPTPILYVRDGVDTQVSRDTLAPANNTPLPVEIIGAAGQDINITAGDINVQLQHNALNPDSTQIGDGVEIMQINAAGEAQVADDTVRTTLASILTQLQELNKPVHRIGGTTLASLALQVATRTLISTVIAGKYGTDIEISYKNGDPIVLHDAATGGNFLGRLTSGGGTIKLNNIPAGTEIYARAAFADFTAVDFNINLNGKDV